MNQAPVSYLAFSPDKIILVLGLIAALMFGLITIYGLVVLISVLSSKVVSDRGKRIPELVGMLMLTLILTGVSCYSLRYLLNLHATVSATEITYDSLYFHYRLPISQIVRIEAKPVYQGSYLEASWVDIYTQTNRQRLDFRFMPQAPSLFKDRIELMRSLH